jgi:RHS repeat-associated protein
VLIDSITTQFLWHGGIIDAKIEGGQITKRYIFINLRPVAVIEYENDTNSDQNSNKNDSASGSKYAGYKPKSTEIYAIHTDHLGTPQAISDSQQAVVWRADYATFGKATVQARVVDSKIKTASSGIISTANAATAAAKPFEFNLRFAGQYEDTESGYHYNWHRYYDPSTGRYLTPDPIGLAGGLNGYGYAGQDPIRRIDPNGLWSTEAHAYFIDQAFAGLPLTLRQAIKTGSEEADSLLYYQTDAYSYMHAMSSAALTKEQAMVKYEQFVADKLNAFKTQIACARNVLQRKAAYAQLGQAMHAVMDSTSPAHRGFQKWESSEALRHGIWPSSEEDIDTAPQYRDETVAKMLKVLNGGSPL